MRGAPPTHSPPEVPFPARPAGDTRGAPPQKALRSPSLGEPDRRGTRGHEYGADRSGTGEAWESLECCRMQLATSTVGAPRWRRRCSVVRCSAVRCARKSVVGREAVGGGVVPWDVVEAGVGAERGRWRRPAVNRHRAPPVVLLVAASERDRRCKRYPRIAEAGPLGRTEGAAAIPLVPMMAPASAADVQGHRGSLAALRGRGGSDLTGPVRSRTPANLLGAASRETADPLQQGPFPGGLLPFVPLADRRRVH
jgi:hypothetical protein